MNETDALALLFGFFGVSKAVGTAFITKLYLFRLAFKTVSERFQKWQERILLDVVESSGEEDDHIAHTILHHRAYRIGVWVVDGITGIKIARELPKTKTTTNTTS
jgi:hypothetical protein